MLADTPLLNWAVCGTLLTPVSVLLLPSEFAFMLPGKSLQGVE